MPSIWKAFSISLKDYQKQIEAAITESIQWLNVQRERQEFMDILLLYDYPGATNRVCRGLFA